jgi:hypothetical protein
VKNGDRKKATAIACALLATTITATLDWALANWSDVAALPIFTPAGVVEGPVVEERRGRFTGAVYERRAAKMGGNHPGRSER